MRTLITPAEAVEYAFGPAGEPLRRPQTEAVIEAAERLYLAPALGGLCDAMREGRYPELLCRVKPALARYVKCMLLPQLAVQAGAGGVGRPRGDSFEPAAAEDVAALAAAVRREADTLLAAVVDGVRASPHDYPEWEPGRTVDAAVRCGVLFGLPGRRKDGALTT